MSSPNFVIELRHVFDPAVLKSLTDLRSLIVTTNAELTDQLNKLADQLDKSRAEVTAAVGVLTKEVSDLQAQIAAGADVPPDVVTAVNRVAAAAQALDDLNPDATA